MLLGAVGLKLVWMVDSLLVLGSSQSTVKGGTSGPGMIL